MGPAPRSRGRRRHRGRGRSPARPGNGRGSGGRDATRAAAVSSQLDSMPRMRLMPASLPPPHPLAQAAHAADPSPRNPRLAARARPGAAGGDGASRRPWLGARADRDRADRDQRRPAARPAALRNGRQGAVDQGAGPRPARGPDRPRGPFDEGRRDDPAAGARHRRDAASGPTCATGWSARRASPPCPKARGSAPRRRGGRRNCWRGGRTSTSCRSAAMSKPGSARSRWARSTRPCSPPPGSTGSAAPMSASSLDDFLPAPAQGAIGVEVRSADRRVRALVAAIDHRPTHAVRRGGAAAAGGAGRELPLAGGGAGDARRRPRSGFAPRSSPRTAREVERGERRFAERRRQRRRSSWPASCSTGRRRGCGRCSRCEAADPAAGAGRLRDRRPGPGDGPRAGRCAALRDPRPCPAPPVEAGALRRGAPDQRQRRAPRARAARPALPCFAVGESTRGRRPGRRASREVRTGPVRRRRGGGDDGGGGGETGAPSVRARASPGRGARSRDRAAGRLRGGAGGARARSRGRRWR